MRLRSISSARAGGISGFVRHRCTDVVGIRLTEKLQQKYGWAGDNGTLSRRNKDLQTQRSEMEERLRESRRRLRELSAHSERAREEERRALARTLHDELGQLFSSIRLELAA